jgi:hypothetical protein
LVSQVVSVLRENVALGAGGGVLGPPAAAGIDPQTQAPVSLDRWLLRLARVLLDALRGDSGAADRLDGLERLPATLQAWCVPPVALVELWCRQPERALDRLTSHLEGAISAGEPRPDEGTFALTARAAADVVASTAGTEQRRRRDALTLSLEEMRSAADDLPVDPCRAVDAASRAGAATYAAEMARLTDQQTVDPWVAAAAEWDKLSRPHDAAYCRWRAAQVALATGRATTATALLRRAARQAREHVPLLDVIAATNR